MVVGAFPAAKLGVLAIKQISKPVANIIKERAKANPTFRKYVCMPPAQAYNWVEVKTKMWAMNLGKPAKVPQLNEAMAIELGANLLGEFIIFAIGAGLLIFEFVRQVNKEAKKEQAIATEKLELQNKICELSFTVEQHAAELREINRVVLGLQPSFKEDNKTSKGTDQEKPVESEELHNTRKFEILKKTSRISN